MTEKEKMLAGQLHTFDDEELIQDARKAEMLCIKYNNTSSEQQSERERLLQDILAIIFTPTLTVLLLMSAKSILERIV